METISEFYYINLDQRVERKKRLEARSKAVGLKNLTRYSGITRQNDSRVDELKASRASEMSFGAIGCVLSHYDLWCQAADSNARIYVQEDDLIYRKDFVEIINNLITFLDSKSKNSWHVIHLNPYFNQTPSKDLYNRPLELNSFTWSTGAYVINPLAAKLLVRYWNLPRKGQSVSVGPKLLPADFVMSWLYEKFPGKSISYFPYPCIQDKLDSDIQPSDEVNKLENDYYYNQYGKVFRNFYDWTATTIDNN